MQNFYGLPLCQNNVNAFYMRTFFFPVFFLQPTLQKWLLQMFLRSLLTVIIRIEDLSPLKLCICQCNFDI
jgi:hypothetical protein